MVKDAKVTPPSQPYPILFGVDTLSVENAGDQATIKPAGCFKKNNRQLIHSPFTRRYYQTDHQRTNLEFDCTNLLATGAAAGFTIDETHSLPVLAVGTGWWKVGDALSSTLSNPQAQFKNNGAAFTEILEIKEQDWAVADPTTTGALGLTRGQWTLYSIGKNPSHRHNRGIIHRNSPQHRG